MDFALNVEEDFGYLNVKPGRDDPFTVSGYGERNGITISFPLYAHEARELIAVLTPLAVVETR